MFFLTFILASCAFSLRADKAGTKDTNIRFSGYIKYDAYIDSKQIVGSSDNYNLFYPAQNTYDPLGVDINRHGQINLVALASRSRMSIKGPTIYDCATKGFFEADINGRSNVFQVLRVRHAFAEVARDYWKVLFGHTWHPFYEPPHTPCPVANNAGQPFETYVRHPQLRASFTKNKSTVVLAALAQIDFLSDGPQKESSVYLRNSMLPELHLQFQQQFKTHWFSLGIDFKRIVPRLVTEKGFSVVEHVNSIMAACMIDLSFVKWSCKTKVIYAENGSEIPLIGGYAVCSIDSLTDRRTYTPLRSVSWWSECAYKLNDKMEPAFFVGYTHALKTRHPILTNLVDSAGTTINERVFGFATDIKSIARFSPRIRYTIDSLELCAELEYTHAWYGILQVDGSLKSKSDTGVLRAMAVVYYHF